MMELTLYFLEAVVLLCSVGEDRFYDSLVVRAKVCQSTTKRVLVLRVQLWYKTIANSDVIRSVKR